MNTLIVALLAAGAAVGVLLVAAGLSGRVVLESPTAQVRQRMSGTVAARYAGAVAAGAVTFAVTGWVVGAIAAGGATVVLPKVLGGKAARQRAIDRTEAIASWSATQDPVIAAVLVPPSAQMTSQSNLKVRPGSCFRSTAARSARPMSRWISSVRPPCFPDAASRLFRVWVARGSIPYSAVNQPPAAGSFAIHGGTSFSTLTVISSLVLPNETSAEPSA